MNSKFLQRMRHNIVYGGAVIAYAIAKRFPRKAGLKLFGFIGAVAFAFPSKDRNRTIEHLTLIYGTRWPEKKILKTAREVYVNLGKNLFDSIHLPGLPKRNLDRIIQQDSATELWDTYNQGRGIVVITAHTGCFEMLLHYFSLDGMKCFAIGRHLFDERLERLIRKTRSGDNIEYMSRSESPRNIIRKLQEGKGFGVLIDQDTKVEGVFANFLGRPAFTPSGPIKMAMKMKLPVFVMTTVRLENEGHYIFISKPLPLADTGDFERDLVYNVQLANDQICTTIERYPSQWVWMHRRWKQQQKK